MVYNVLMDTQTPQQPTADLTPGTQMPGSTPPNKRWEIIVGIILIVIIAGAGGYYLLSKNKATPKEENTVLPPVVEQQPIFPPIDDSKQIKNYTVGDVRNADFSRPSAINSKFYIIDDRIPLTNGVGTFSYCEEDYSCTYNKAGETKKATVTLSNITAPTDSALLQNLEWGGSDGVMIMTFDFGNQAPREYYLSTFALNKQTGQDTYTLYTPPIKNLGTLEGTISKVEVTGKNEITIAIKKPSGDISRAFSIIAGHRNYDLTELTPDRTGKIYDDQRFGYNFTYPNDVSVYSYYRGVMRNTFMETELGVSPVYHAQECGLQPTFADSGVSIWSSNQSLNANLTVHRIGPSTLYLTSALYGYDPADWGKVKQQVSIQDYVNSIKSGAQISGRKVTQENIQGYAVRHIAPFSAGRPCDTQYREQYQWIAGSLLFNLIFTNASSEPALSDPLKAKLINSVFSSLQVK